MNANESREPKKNKKNWSNYEKNLSINLNMKFPFPLNIFLLFEIYLTNHCLKNTTTTTTNLSHLHHFHLKEFKIPKTKLMILQDKQNTFRSFHHQQLPCFDRFKNQ